MAQKSKKQHIVQTALPLLLKNGFKGTSVDLVVKQSGVSKPTVYNHFPDKSALMFTVVEYWIAQRSPDLDHLEHCKSVESMLNEVWLTADTMLFYALVIGEGRRFQVAIKLFWQSFDQVWRDSIKQVIEQRDWQVAPYLLDHSFTNKIRLMG